MQVEILPCLTRIEAASLVATHGKSEALKRRLAPTISATRTLRPKRRRAFSLLEKDLSRPA